MRPIHRPSSHPRLFLIPILIAGLGCQDPQAGLNEIKVQRYVQRMADERPAEITPDLTAVNRPAPVELSRSMSSTEMPLNASFWIHLPDPTMAAQALDKRLAITRFGQDSIRREHVEVYNRTKRYIQEMKRPQQVRLTLSDCLRRALANNYAIKIEGYSPAISTAQVVQAEAAFDVAFFANISRNNTDQPTPSALLASQTDTTVVGGGISKLLATGATVTVSENMVRIDNPGFQFNLLNPSWIHNLTTELRQPLLRNFGVDFNRSQINISRNQRKINEQAFKAQVIDVLVNTETAYWQLVAARRSVVILAELLSQSEYTYEQMEARAEFDVYPSLVSRSRANVKRQESVFIEIRNQVHNAEDQLLNLMNDPELPLSADYEIIPVDNPTTLEIIRDRFATVEAALKHRPEILQSRHTVENAKIALGIAKNQALPQLDVIYRMTVNGLGASSDQAFDQMTGGNFIDQFVGLEFLWSPGERRERAGIRIAAFQQSQAVLAYKQALDGVITDCRVALRTLDTRFEQLTPSNDAMLSAAETLRSLQERQETKNPQQLDTILNSQIELATRRQNLLQAAIDYNTGIVDVERAKGTLLEYNNVVLTEQP